MKPPLFYANKVLLLIITERIWYRNIILTKLNQYQVTLICQLAVIARVIILCQLLSYFYCGIAD